MSETSSTLMEDIRLQVQESRQAPSRINPKKISHKNITVKLLINNINTKYKRQDKNDIS